MADSQIFQMPMKFGLKFMTIISSDSMNTKGKFVYNIVGEIDSIFLSMSL